MAARILPGLVAGIAFLAGGTAGAAPSVEQILQFKPKQDGVSYSTPAAEELKACEVKLVKGSRQGSSGWLLVDSKKIPLRRFFDGNGDNHIDVYSYYKDGIEVYREIDTNFNQRMDQYRWLNAGGMKWGVDVNEDGKIDAWKMISAEEAAQEVFQAAATRDFERLRILFLNEQEMRTLKLPAPQIERIRGLQKDALKKFQDTLAKSRELDAKAAFVRVESATPGCLPGDALGMEQDLVKFSSRAILYEVDAGGKKQHEWLHTGEMIQVGNLWRLIDAPGTHEGGSEMVASIDGQTGNPSRSNPELQKLLEELSKLDQEAPVGTTTGEPNRLVAAYNSRRVGIIEKILPHVQGEDRERWVKQIFDNLSTASQAGDNTALPRLSQYREQIVKGTSVGSNLAAYAVYRELWAAHGSKLIDRALPAAQMQKLQDDWLEKLAKFVQSYPRSEDTPDALHHLGMGHEFSGRDEEAKRWYEQLAKNFAEHALAEKATGCVRRLGLIGRELELQGPRLKGGQTFNIVDLKGKVVAVYYWASYIPVTVGDIARLRQLQSSYAAKGFELVCVNLDDQPADALKHLQANPLEGAHHLFQPARDGGGLNSPLATSYGINGLPTLFLIGRDGRVVNRTLQVNDLEDALKKAL
jgi:thiol-disulfide isomerase/thioredoxin